MKLKREFFMHQASIAQERNEKGRAHQKYYDTFASNLLFVT